jgi:hypothetical protein
MLAEQLHSVSVEVEDSLDAIDLCYRQGWTDGLPVVPPTVERVEAMLRAAGRPPDEILGTVPERRRTVTVEKVAANAVMAGCLPVYFPVVLAAVEGVLDPRFSLIGPSSSTAGVGVAVIVNGPYAAQIDLNAADNLLGPGNRANATIGRAVRLVLINACGAVPGLFDRSAFGHAGKYTLCFGENEADSPWTPLHVEREVPADVSAVTVFAAASPVQVDCRVTPRAETILAAIADTMATVAPHLSPERRPEMLIVLGFEHMLELDRQGWNKPRIRAYLFEHSTRTAAHLKCLGRMSGEVKHGDEVRSIHATAAPDQLLIVAAGGRAGRYSLVIPGWPGGDSRAVTKGIGVCLEC